jgi:apolipoprotein D and lipocalin family protein
MKVVRDLDLERYMGQWYEIAFLPSMLQTKNCASTRATYTLGPYSTVKVLNERSNDGRHSSIEGTAYRADPASNEAKLKVKFYVPTFLPIVPIVFNYWVLHIDNAYQYALVGEPSREILSVRRLSPDFGNSVQLQRWCSPQPNPGINSVGLDETLAWGAPNFQPSPQVDAQISAFLS